MNAGSRRMDPDHVLQELQDQVCCDPEVCREIEIGYLHFRRVRQVRHHQCLTQRELGQTQRLLEIKHVADVFAGFLHCERPGTGDEPVVLPGPVRTLCCAQVTWRGHRGGRVACTVQLEEPRVCERRGTSRSLGKLKQGDIAVEQRTA